MAAPVEATRAIKMATRPALAGSVLAAIPEAWEPLAVAAVARARRTAARPVTVVRRATAVPLSDDGTTSDGGTGGVNPDSGTTADSGDSGTAELKPNLIGPLDSYYSACDSPFSLAGMGSDAVLETFEDNSLHPAVSASYGSIDSGNTLVDSVDGDTGAIDGDPSTGHAFFVNPGSTGVTFPFDAGMIGFAPTYAGIVFTDGLGDTYFEAFDTEGNSLGVITDTSTGVAWGGEVDEDRFFGIEWAKGIGSIFISNDEGAVDVDHLQFGRDLSGTTDCNTNMVRDVCELVANDSNNSGIPDDCDD